uniref:Uncharacterized protein n=1 Tax=Phaeomonas parva TaxID=124430 RepID=A0A6U4K512_9STRA|mmetsp:Transcript_45888/g.143598  ORF Transcript_45888/g.143598 Transcript_45888/m.143598 type:complete len:139 (+) Transcript_45888:125-541(+)
MTLPRGYDEKSWAEVSGPSKALLTCRKIVNTQYFLWYPWSNGGWTMLFVLGHILFWVYGFTAINEFGYTDSNKYDEGPTDLGTGGVASGPSGSGVFMISLFLVIPITLIYIKQGVAAFSKFGGKVFRETEYHEDDLEF